jgi:uncharacterized protein YydD (DUF2326 family)
MNFFFFKLIDAESQASLLCDRDVINKIKCLIDIERKLRLELAEHEKKVRKLMRTYLVFS